jgi:hypothetical protein
MRLVTKLTSCDSRLSPAGMEHVSNLFAWDEDNAELWRRYPHLSPGIRIHITGNPRVDLQQ